MGAIIAVATGKGGAGKTTLTICLAHNLVVDGSTVAVLDGDPSGDYTEWNRDVYGGAVTIKSVHEVSPEKIVDIAQSLAEDHDVVLIDTAGFGNQAAVTAIGTADGVLIPAGSARKELLEADKAYRLVQSLAKGGRREIKSKVVLIGIKPRSAVGKFTREQTAELGLPLSKGYLTDRVAYIELTHSGNVPTSGIERQEISRILDEMREEGWIPEVAGSD